MFNFNKPLAALAFLTLITTGVALPSAANALTPAQRLCRVDQLPPGVKPACTVIVTSRAGATVRSSPGSNYKKIRILPYNYDVNVTVSKSSRDWVKLSDAPGWINTRQLEKVGD